MKFLLVAAWFLASGFAHADPVSELVEKLKGTDEKYEIVGTICEQAARLELEREFQPPRFAIETGISYGNDNRTIGELDVVIFDSDKKVAMVAEVKCWRSFDGALRKARDQRSRFQAAIKSGAKLKFWDGSDRHDLGQFKQIKYFDSISQKGGKAEGFDRELGLSLEQLMEARQRLLSCQSGRSC